MAKQLNVNLAFTADTGKAKAQLQDLQNQLNKVINMPAASLPTQDMEKNLKSATHAAAELKVHLENAMNPKTGTLDFTKLNQSIKSSGSSLTEYAAKLNQIGPEGQKAFMMLAQSVASAEVPIRRSNQLLTELWTTMKNTARWQLTSSMLHGFMGAVQSAVGYAEDLNESLNNIRIVTGQSVDQMRDFAKEANKAAKSLSTSTTNYTNAALIYYQQGLNEKAVKERTDITVQMANVSRQATEEVSDQMTAIWNNYAKGGEDLEHFANAMVKLGADTASSSSEIAQGLEKFAAIGDTIGLSFDNAAAALATVTATTRQSADVVGTAFKTMFARIQGLNLGETLDDGTTLNKYSEALDKVGISIFDQSGQLKDMNSILEEMGAKWETLSKDQQVGLAQTVAGVRQYTQLVALMDNFDFYKQNLSSAQNSDGALKKQAEIYEESWEAANKRLRASMEDLWADLIDDEAFIDVINALEKVVSAVDMIAESLGGFKGILLTTGALFTRVFQKQISKSLVDATYSMKTWTKAGRESINQERIRETQGIMSQLDPNGSQSLEIQLIQDQLIEQQKLLAIAGDISEEERKTLQYILDQKAARKDNVLEAQKQVKSDTKKVNNAYGQMASLLSPDKMIDAQNALQDMFYINPDYLSQKKSIMHRDIIDMFSDEEVNAVRGVEINAINKLRQQGFSPEEIQSVMQYAESYVNLSDSVDNANASYKDFNDTTLDAQVKQRMGEEAGQAFIDSLKKTGETAKKSEEELKKYNKTLTSQQKAQNFTNAANAALSLASAYTSLSTAIETFNNTDMSSTEKVTSILTSVSSAGLAFASGVDSIGKIATSSGKSLLQLAGGFGKLSIYIGIAMAAIAAITWAFDKWNKYVNRHKIAAEEAAQAFEDLKNSAEEASKKLKEVASAKDEYDGLIEKLKSCDKGTNEWYAALDAVNEKIKEIIDIYPELLEIEGMFDPETGQLNQEKFAKFLKDKERQESINEGAIVLGEQNKNRKENESNRAELRNKFSDVLSTASTNYNGIGGEAIVANSKQIFDEIEAHLLSEDNKDFTISQEKLTEILDKYGGATGNFSNDIAKKLLAGNGIDTIKGNIIAGKKTNIAYDTSLNRFINDQLGAYASQEQKQQYANTFNENVAQVETDYAGLKNGMSHTALVLQNLLTEAYGKGNIPELKVGEAIKDGKLQLASGVEVDLNTLKMQAAARRSVISGETAALNAEDYTGTSTNGRLTAQFEAEYLNELSAAQKIDLDNYIQSIHSTDREQVIQSVKDKLDSVDSSEWGQVISDLYSTKTFKADLANAAKDYELDEKEIENYAESLVKLAKTSDKIDDSLSSNEELVKDITIAHARLNKGLEDLADNYDEYAAALRTGDETSIEYQNAIMGMKESMEDLLGIDNADILSNEFLSSEESLRLMQEAIDGNIESLDKLHEKASSEILKESSKRFMIDSEEMSRGWDQLGEELYDIQTQMANVKDTLQTGESFIPEGGLGELNQFLLESKMMAEDADAYFKSLGFIPKIEKVKQTVFELSPDGIWEAKTIDVPQITDLNYIGPKAQIVNSSNKTGTKTKTAKKSDIVERYKEINDTLKRVQNTMSDLEKISDRVFGNARIEALKKINSELEKEKSHLETKRTEAIGYLDQDKTAINTAANKLGVSFNFDENGNISNYTDVMTGLYNKYKNNPDALEDLQDAIQQYEETKDELLDINDAIDDTFYKWQDNNYEQLTYRLEFHLEIDDMALKDIEYRLKKYEDNPEKRLEALLGGKEGSNVPSQLALINSQGALLVETYEQLQEQYKLGKISQEDYVEGLQTVYDNIYEQKEAIDELNETMLNFYTDTYAKIMDNIDKYMDRMEKVNGILDHYSNLIGLLGLGENSVIQDTLLGAQRDTAKNKFESSKAVSDEANSQLEKRQQEYDNIINSDASEEAKEIAKQNLEAAREQALNAYDTMLQDAATYAQAVQDVLTSKVKQAAKEMEDALTNGVGFDALEKRLEHSKEMADEYLTDTNKMYETDKMLREIQQKSDKTTNGLAKQRLKDFSDEIKAMQSKGQLSKLELEIAQKRFSVLEAQIALEEAQNAKSTVRLQRDSEGNFGYVYTADSEKIADAEQNLADAENDLYNTRLNAANEYAEKTLQVQRELTAELAEIEEAYQNNAYENEEEYRRARAEAIARADEKLLTYQEQYNIATLENYEEANDLIHQAKQELAENNKKILDQEKFDEDEWIAGRNAAYDSYYDGLEGFQADYVTTTNANTPLIQEAWEGTYGIMNTSAQNWQTALTGEDGYINKVNKAFEDAELALQDVAELMNLDLQDIRENGVDPTSASFQAFKKLIEGEGGEGGVVGASNALKDAITGQDGLVNAMGVELNGVVDDITEKFGLQSEAISILQGDYDNLAASIRAAISELNKYNSLSKTPSNDLGEKQTPNSPPPKVPSGNSSPLVLGDDEEGGTGENKDGENSGLIAWYSGNIVISKTPKTTMIDGEPKTYFQVTGAAQSNLMGKWIAASDLESGVEIGENNKYNRTYSIKDGEIKFLETFNTGGYTGEWGPEGKLAMLHQKELVLNADDTSNILQTVAFMRELVSMLDKQASMASLFNMSAIGGINSHTNALNQTITIHADFPTATDRNEIEEAFKNIINTASQYANRK